MRVGCEMTDIEKKIMIFIKCFILKNGYPPTTREIGQGVNIKSSSSVNWYLKKLRENGHINYVDAAPRTITLVGYKVKLVPDLPNDD